MSDHLPIAVQRHRARQTKRTPYRLTTSYGLYCVWRIRGGLAFLVASAFSHDEAMSLAEKHEGKARGAGIPLKQLAAI